ncbi:MAG TPA: TonB family protein [Terriglobales bacterium]|nr:TonB family protein [Terriglobales bacterium]
MSYRALLFCPDEAAARLVTQVLSELEFTVELSFEPFVTVQKLTTEAFDAVVVDCTNEENASLLFKGARNSSLNHSSLCVAVVEGQMGVAKAFRIGANLVLTKPINIEQSKGTLRVARGLLRKGESKPQSTPGAPGAGSSSTIPVSSPIIASQPAPTAASMPVAAASLEPPASARPAASVPTSLFEAQQAASSANETKLGEKSPAFLVQKSPAAEPISAPPAKSRAEKFAGGIPMGAAAAPAMAPEKPTPSPSFITPPDSETQKGSRVKTAAPLATQEAIVPEKRFREREVAHAPTFGSYTQQSSTSSGSSAKIVWTIIVLLVLGPAGYFGWRKLQPLRYIHRAPAILTESPSASPQPSASDASPSAAEPQAGTASVPAAETANNSGAPIIANGAPEGFPTKETIEVDQPSDKPDPPITVVPKPEPLQVKQKPIEPVEAQPTPPPVVLPESKATDSTLEGLVTPNVAVPNPVPGALQVSEGVTQGLLIKKIAPSYPATALKLRKQGAVGLLATVSKTGTITKIKVLSGDSLLTQAAVDAVRQWKYRPFLLNAEPVEIETQITINFKLPN